MRKRLDPTRTTSLRRAFMADMLRRIKELKKSIITVIVDLDMFGLMETPNPLQFNAKKIVLKSSKLAITRRQYEFKTNPEKLEAFKVWMQGQVDAGILEVASDRAAWMHTYVNSAYRKGVVRAYADTHKEALAESTDFYTGSKMQFLSEAFAAPETMAKIQMLYTRSYDELKGFTSQMAQDTSRIVAGGISNGNAPVKIAKELTKQIDTLTKKRALTIARTEVIRAHAEGQLDSFDRMNVKEVGVEAEFSTANDGAVCAICSSIEGEIMSVSEARGLIPVHPSCRCSWVPYLK
jgi:SPP1 gp7 family putative phage head morphogenesis protein